MKFSSRVEQDILLVHWKIRLFTIYTKVPVISDEKEMENAIPVARTRKFSNLRDI